MQGFRFVSKVIRVNSVGIKKHIDIYFKACGELTRTVPCAGRKTKREQKRE